MKLCLLAVSLILVCEFALAVGSESFAGVVRIQTQPGSVIVGDAFLHGESSAITSITTLENEELSYFSYPSPTNSQAATYFFYAQFLILEFTCAVLVNGKEVSRNTSVVEIEAEPGQVYVAKPEYLENYLSCETNFLPQQRPNKSLKFVPAFGLHRTRHSRAA